MRAAPLILGGVGLTIVALYLLLAVDTKQFLITINGNDLTIRSYASHKVYEGLSMLAYLSIVLIVVVLAILRLCVRRSLTIIKFGLSV